MVFCVGPSNRLRTEISQLCAQSGLDKLLRRAPELLTKTLAEISMAAEANTVSDLVDGKVALFQQFSGMVQPHRANEHRSRPIGERVQLAVQLRAAELEPVRQGFHAEGLVFHVLFDDFLHAFQKGLVKLVFQGRS